MVSKGFGGAIRPSDTGDLRKLGLQIARVSLRAPLALRRTLSKNVVIAMTYHLNVSALFASKFGSGAEVEPKGDRGNGVVAAEPQVSAVLNMANDTSEEAVGRL